MDLTQFLRRTVHLFSLSEFYVKAGSPILTEEGELVGLPKEFTLWLARAARLQPPIFIFDTDGYVNPHTLEYSLTLMSEDEIAYVIQSLPSSRLRKLIAILEEWGVKPARQKGDSEEDLKAKLLELDLVHRIFFRPVPRLKSIDFLKDFDLREFVEELVAFRAEEKDPRLREVFKAHLLRGLLQRINPHSLNITNPGTGRTSFYRLVGHVFEKVTAKSFLGFARSPEEIYPGTVDRTELPILIDQLESQDAPKIARHLLEILESGLSEVSSGATKFPVRSNSIFTFAANPIGFEEDPQKSFASLLVMLSENIPAWGRRIGLIVYGTDFTTIEKKLKDDTEWRRMISLFRALEEYAWKELKKIIEDPRVKEWLLKPIENYAEEIRELTSFIKDEALKDFLRSHGEAAQHRVRGAALYSVLALNLDKIALKEYSIEKLLREAEERLKIYVEINLQSIANIANDAVKIQEHGVKAFFESLPEYLREIISAVELYKRRIHERILNQEKVQDEELEVFVNDIPYLPEKSTYNPISKAVWLARNRGTLRKHTKRIKKYFGFELTEEYNTLIAKIYDHTPAPIEPLGTLLPIKPAESSEKTQKEGVTPSSVSSISSIHQLSRETCVSTPLEKSTNSQVTSSSEEQVLLSESDEMMKMMKVMKTKLSKNEGNIENQKQVKDHKNMREEGVKCASKLVCRKCGKAFSSLEEYEKHWAEAHSNEPLTYLGVFEAQKS